MKVSNTSSHEEGCGLEPFHQPDPFCLEFACSSSGFSPFPPTVQRHADYSKSVNVSVVVISDLHWDWLQPPSLAAINSTDNGWTI